MNIIHLDRIGAIDLECIADIELFSKRVAIEGIHQASHFAP